MVKPLVAVWNGIFIRSKFINMDIRLLDVFALNYYGILVFFQVCKVTENSVFLVELATKRYKNGIRLTKHFSASKKPYIILNNNIYTRSTYEVYPIRNGYSYLLPIEVDIDSPLYQEALNRTEYPVLGTVYASPIYDYANKYWIIEDFNINEKLDGLA